MNKVLQFLVDKLDADKNGKVNLKDAEAKFGVLFVRGFLIGGGAGVLIGWGISKLLK